MTLAVHSGRPAPARVAGGSTAAPRATPAAARRRARRGFTLVEMLVVLMIIAVLMAATLGGLKTARRMAWRTKARDMARQVVAAWNVYLIEQREFPPEDQFKDVTPDGFAATAANLKPLYSGANVYLELSEQELHEDRGLKDRWGNYLGFNLDFDYDGQVVNPAPAANNLAAKDNAGEVSVKGTSIAWSMGELPDRRQRWLVQW